MRLLLILLALCGCQSASPLRLYDGPDRPNGETTTISLVSGGSISDLWKGDSAPFASQILEVNGRKALAREVEVLPGRQTLLIEGFYGDPDRSALVKLMAPETRIAYGRITKQVEFEAKPGRRYTVQAEAEGKEVPTSFGRTRSWRYAVQLDTEIVQVNTKPWTPARKLPDLSLGYDWTPYSGLSNWHKQSEGFVGTGENEVQFTKKVYLLAQTDGAAKDGFSLKSVTKKSGLDLRRFIQVPGTRIFDFQVGEGHWLEKWREAYADGKGKWGVTVYRVHGDDLVMLAYVCQETEDAAVLDQWAKRFLDANLPTPR